MSGNRLGKLSSRISFYPYSFCKSYTALRNLVTPDVGGDTIFSSGAAVYASLSPFYQKYLESLSAVHSGHEQAKGARSAGQHVRREPIETVHPVVRVHPVTGIKSVFFNAGFARRIVGVPKAEGDNVMRFLNEQFAVNHDVTWRVKWEKDDVVIWDVSAGDGVTLSKADLFSFRIELLTTLRKSSGAGYSSALLTCLSFTACLISGLNVDTPSVSLPTPNDRNPLKRTRRARAKRPKTGPMSDTRLWAYKSPRLVAVSVRRSGVSRTRLAGDVPSTTQRTIIRDRQPGARKTGYADPLGRGDQRRFNTLYRPL